MVKDSAYTDEQTEFNNIEGKLIWLLNKLKTGLRRVILFFNVVIDFGDDFQPTSELDPYEADSDQLELDLTED